MGRMHDNHDAHLKHLAAASTPHTLQLGVPVASHHHTVLIFPHTPLLLLLLLLCLLQLLRLPLLLLRWLMLKILVHYRLLGARSLPTLLRQAVVLLLLLLWGARVGLGQGGQGLPAHTRCIFEYSWNVAGNRQGMHVLTLHDANMREAALLSTA